MDVAELYLSLTRPSGIPVVGECVAEGFLGQIQVEKWSWNLMNDEEIKRASKEGEKYTKHEQFLGKQLTADLQEEILKLKHGAADQKASESFRKTEEESRKELEALRKKLGAAQGSSRAVIEQQIESIEKQRAAAAKSFQEARDKAEEALRDQVDELYNEFHKAADKQDQNEKDLAEAIEKVNKRIENRQEENKSYEFNFSKRVDFATTQMLNSMKAGDVFPMAVLTILQRSSNAGMALVFTVTNLRLLDYNLRAEVSDTMTDMKEQWKAEFRSLAYVYKNRKAIDSSDDPAEKAAKAASQGTVRTFMMKKDLGI